MIRRKHDDESPDAGKDGDFWGPSKKGGSDGG